MPCFIAPADADIVLYGAVRVPAEQPARPERPAKQPVPLPSLRLLRPMKSSHLVKPVLVERPGPTPVVGTKQLRWADGVWIFCRAKVLELVRYLEVRE